MIPSLFSSRHNSCEEHNIPSPVKPLISFFFNTSPFEGIVDPIGAKTVFKPFFTLENHRVGVRFTKQYVDDGVSMLNEVKMQNNYSMALGVEYMRNFSPDYNWEKYRDLYETVCANEDLVWTDTIIFGLGDDIRHSEYNRGVPGNYRVCISEWLGDC